MAHFFQLINSMIVMVRKNLGPLFSAGQEAAIFIDLSNKNTLFLVTINSFISFKICIYFITESSFANNENVSCLLTLQENNFLKIYCDIFSKLKVAKNAFIEITTITNIFKLHRNTACEKRERYLPCKEKNRSSIQ